MLSEHGNGDSSESKPNLENGSLTTSLLSKSSAPFSYKNYFKKHYLLAGSFALNLISVAVYEYYVQQFDEKGLQQTGEILPKLFNQPSADFTTDDIKPIIATLSWILAISNGYMDFSFIRLKDFIDGYEKVFPGGFFSGLSNQISKTFSSCGNFFTLAPTTIIMLGAFLSLSYASVMTLDISDDKGGNSPLRTAGISALLYGSLVNYILAQAPDTYKGIKFYLQSTKDEKAQQTLAYYFFKKEGLKLSVIQTEIIRQFQNIMRGISGGFYAKYFLEFRQVSPDSAWMKIAPVLFGIFTGIQSHIARGPGIYQRRMGTDEMRFDLVSKQVIQDKFNKVYAGKWERFIRILHPVSLAQAGFFGYTTGRFSTFVFGSSYAGWAIGTIFAMLSGKLFYEADQRRNLTKLILSETTNIEEERDFSYYWSFVVVLLSYAARTINGVPSTMSLLSFLDDTDRIVLAYTIGTLVSAAGFEYYLPKVHASTKELSQLLTNKCSIAACKNALFYCAKNDVTGINNSDETYDPPPVRSVQYSSNL